MSYRQALEEQKETVMDDTEVSAAKKELDDLIKAWPPQLQMVWDNLNLSSKHRFERKGDISSQTRKDWMSSLWIKDRIDVSHMQYEEGSHVKDVNKLKS